MASKEEITELLGIAKAANLDGLDFLAQFTEEQLADGYNGIGPEFLGEAARKKVSEFLNIFRPAAVGHDLRNEMSDGTREGFKYANEEFLRNCLKLADYYYKDKDARRHLRARAAARILYCFVSAENFGWRAWLEAKERHAQKLISDNSVWKNKGVNMKKLMMMFAAGAAILMTGCSVTKVNYEKDDTGKVSYRLYRNDHWLKTSGTGISGGMTKDGKFEFAAEGLERSPSEEFNRTMQTYTTAFIQLAQIAAAAYNPSASAVTASKQTSETAQTQATAQTPAATEVQTVAAQTQAAAASSDGSQDNAECADGACKDGSK